MYSFFFFVRLLALALVLLWTLPSPGQTAGTAAAPTLAAKPKPKKRAGTGTMIRDRENWLPGSDGRLQAPLAPAVKTKVTVPNLKPEDPLINVNGDVLTWGAAKRQSELMIAEMRLPAGVTAADVEAERDNLLMRSVMKVAEHFITKTVLAQEAKRNGLAVKRNEFEERQAAIIAQVKKSRKNPAAYLKEVETPGSFIMIDLTNTLLSAQLTQEVIRPSIKITDDDASRYIEDRVKKNQEIKTYNAGLRPKIEDLLKQLKAGASFYDLAFAESDCDSSAEGGEWGTFKPEDIREELAAVAFKMEEGKISDVVETPFSYHILKLLKRNQPTIRVQGATNELPSVSVKLAHIMLEKKTALPVLDSDAAKKELLAIRVKETVDKLKSRLIKSAKIETPLQLY